MPRQPGLHSKTLYLKEQNRCSLPQHVSQNRSSAENTSTVPAPRGPGTVHKVLLTEANQGEIDHSVLTTWEEPLSSSQKREHKEVCLPCQ